MTIKKIKDFVEGRDVRSTEPGERMRQTYKLIEIDGVKYLEPDDYYDLQEEINSYEPSVNFHNIIDRYMKGDLDVLDKAQAFFADVSKMPKNFKEVMDISKRGEAAFNLLPSEVRALFGENYVEFIQHPEILNDYIERNYMERAKNEKVVSNENSENEKVEA